MSKNPWTKRVGKVFDLRPRIGTRAPLWLERRAAMQRFAEALARSGGHVCVDGPTGAGKTSLVLTHIFGENLRHVTVMATGSMNWQQFCRQLIGAPDNSESTVGGQVEVGVDKGLPVAKLRISLGDKGRPIDDLALAQNLSRDWTEHDVAARLKELDALLVVDDLELADDALLKRLADLCKLLTQAYVSDNAKVALVGSRDLFKRVHRQNPALDERLAHISVGAFKLSSDSRYFLIKGLNKLGLRHPWNSKIPEQFEKHPLCTTAIWEAADGLPKSLNRLGYDIAMRGRGRTGVSYNDVLELSNAMTEEHWIEYADEYPETLKFLASDKDAVTVVKALYGDGIARIHKIPDLIAKHKKSADAVPVECWGRTIDKLKEIGFLVRTGKSGELVFVSNPTAAHTLGIVLRNPDRFADMRSFMTGSLEKIEIASGVDPDADLNLEPSDDA